MGNQPLTIDLIALHEAIQATLKEHLVTDVHDVSYYARPGEKIKTPAVFFDLTGIVPARDPDVGTEQTQVILRFSAWAVQDFKGDAKLRARLLASRIIALLKNQRWEMPLRVAGFSDAMPDHFRSDNPAYEVWRVDWSHQALLGESIWQTT